MSDKHKEIKKIREKTVYTPLDFIMSIPTNPNKKRYFDGCYQYGSFKGKGSGCWL